MRVRGDRTSNELVTDIPVSTSSLVGANTKASPRSHRRLRQLWKQRPPPSGSARLSKPKGEARRGKGGGLSNETEDDGFGRWLVLPVPTFSQQPVMMAGLLSGNDLLNYCSGKSIDICTA